MNSNKFVNGIIRARASSARTLLQAIKNQRENFSEIDLASEWIKCVRKDHNILPFGWYQPPPNGMSVLIGNPPSYNRIKYSSLRTKNNWPSRDYLYSEESIIYPYFSSVDRETLMIGDHVCTYYSGKNLIVKDWISTCFSSTKKIINSIKIGMVFSDIYEICNDVMRSIGATNNTFSLSGGLANDIGHTVPRFNLNDIEKYDYMNIDIPTFLGSSRNFISKDNNEKIPNTCAFTIEPQLLAESLPMSSFHFIVGFVDGEKFVVDFYNDLFDYFGMNNWLK